MCRLWDSSGNIVEVVEGRSVKHVLCTKLDLGKSQLGWLAER